MSTCIKIFTHITHLCFDSYNRRGPRRKDHRTRRDRVLRRNDAFRQQLPVLTEAYLNWSHERAQKDNKEYFPIDVGNSDKSWSLQVIDVYRELLLHTT